MTRQPLNQLQIMAQASSFLAGLAKECRMAITIHPSQTVAELQHEIAAAGQRADALRTEWQKDMASLPKLKAYERVLEQLSNLDAQLREAKLYEDFHNQSV